MKKEEKPIIAIMYDFDKTLSKSDMQDYGFIPALGLTPAQFWGKTGEFQNESNMERILSYMYTMVKLSKEKGIKLTRKTLNDMGKNIEFFPGVDTWFERINKWGEQNDVIVEHYIISSGTKEILEGCPIAKHFKEMFGCEFYFDPVTEEPVWPKLAINYTQKTQFIYRIRKNSINISDDTTINTKDDTNIRIPYTNMIYLGDGMTDIPCMMLVQKNYGHSIALYSENDKSLEKLLKEKRVDICCKADYREGKELDAVVKSIIQSIANERHLEMKAQKLRDKLGID